MGSRASLPIDAYLDEIRSALEREKRLVVVAEPGAGKTTRVPPALLQNAEGSWILMQPRRIAAMLCAEWIARESGSRLGEEIGYQIRFENETSERTRLKVVTEGILLRLMESDLELKGVEGVILDEFHERNLFADVSLAMLKDVQKNLRPDLKILVMSATLDEERVSRFLDQAPIVRVPGRVFPVDVSYRPSKQRLEQRVANAVASLFASPGDIPATQAGQKDHVLVFLPGWSDIMRAKDALEEAGVEAPVYVLHSRVPISEQERALQDPAPRKIILSTNIAETSVTIDGVHTVIDSGLAKTVRVDPQLGLEKLDLGWVSRASAIQRAGRAGRLAPGRCIRLYAEGEFASFKPYETPEILRSDPSRILLQLAAMGVSDFESFPWYEAPPRSQLKQALSLLRLMQAFDSKGGITPLGRRLLQYPLPLRLAALLEFAKMGGVVPWAIELIERVSQDAPLGQELRRRYGGLTRASKLPDTEVQARAMYSAFPDRLFKLESKAEGRGRMSGGRRVILAREVLPEGEYGFALRARENQVNGHKVVFVEDAFFLTEEEFRKVFARAFEKKTNLIWDDERKRVQAFEQMALGDFPIQNGTEVAPSKEEAGEELSRQACLALDYWIKHADGLGSLLERLRFWKWHDADAPSIDASTWKSVFDAACVGKRSFEELLQEPLIEYLKSSIGFEIVQKLDRLCPERMVVPSGRAYKIDYSTEKPTLEVRLQEVFGWEKTPTVLGGRVGVKMVLLAPNYRPTQITEDLKSFWERTYPEVRKELRARYPKHAWPEDPKTARPIAK